MADETALGIRTTHTQRLSARLRGALLAGLLGLTALAGCADDGAAADAARERADRSTTSTAPSTSTTTEPERGPDPADLAGIWVSPGELAALPTRGVAWRGLLATAESDWGEPRLGDQDSRHDTDVLAGALVAVRRVDDALRARVVEALEDVRGSYPDEVLPVARNLVAYVVAADLVDLDDPSFDAWLVSLLDHEASSRAGIRSLRESAERDPSNHGTHARAAVLAVALRVGDVALVDEMAQRFHDWLGRSSEGWEWRELDWQADPERPVGINRPGAVIQGLDVDGVLPEEQRRSGGFTTDPEREGYVWEALQGATVTAELLARAGYPAWSWEDAALPRAYRWLHEVNDFPAEGDDTWLPWVVNARTGADFPAPTPTEPGKNLGYSDWTHPSEP